MDKNTRHDRQLDCRYYNGEQVAPDGVNHLFWGYERGWVEGHHENWETEKEDLRRLGLENFESGDGTPYELKCLLFNRYCHWSYYFEKDDFLKWYKENYQSPRLTNRQRRYLHRKEKLTKRCRYYKGESENPFKGTPDEMKWNYESCWVEQLSESYENAKSLRWEVKNDFDEIAEKYNVPRSLIGLFMNRFEHWACLGPIDEEAFRDWLLHDYLKLK